jgi:hypothetical protein
MMRSNTCARGKLALQWQVVIKEVLDNANVIGEPAVKRQRLKRFQYNALLYINVALLCLFVTSFRLCVVAISCRVLAKRTVVISSSQYKLKPR